MSAIDQIKEDEGFSGVPYNCPAGFITIGYGRNLEANPLTREEAEYLLNNDLKKVTKQAMTLPYYTELTPERRAVVINMIYNLGYPRFKGFRLMHKALCEKNYLQAASEMLDSKWAVQVGDRAKRLAEQMK